MSKSLIYTKYSTDLMQRHNCLQIRVELLMSTSTITCEYE